MRSVAPLAVVLALAVPASAAAKVTVPDGDYSGPRHFFVRASGKQIEVIAFNFPCAAKHHVHGRMAIDDIPLKKTDSGYTFSITAYGSASYSDEKPDQNGKTTISGHFGRKARTAKGHYKTSTPRCGSTKKLDWAVTRSAAERR